MAEVVSGRSTTRRRTVVYSIGVGVTVLLLVAGLAFANSISVTRVTNNARSLHWTNATLGTSALTRAGLVQAITFGELEGEGVVTDEDMSFAMDQLHASDDELDQLVSIGQGYDSYGPLTRYLTPVDDAIAALEAGDIDGAKTIVTTDVERTYIELVESLTGEQQVIQAAIDDNSAAGRALNGWIVFLLTLAVPGSAVVVYFVVARRQVRVFKEQSRLELEAERRISRAKDAFIAGLSHELRTPLTSIYGFAEIMAEGAIKGHEATVETAGLIANEAAEMTRMVDDLLAASRLESTGIEIEMAPTRLQQVIDAAAAPFERAGMDLRREPTNAMAMADAARLRHVLINLISNAARHGGSVAGIEVTSGEGTVDIEIWDNGPGVPDGVAASLFQRFVHDGDKPLLTGSVGLGLAVASHLTSLMGGTLQYQRFGNKTYFVVSLPQAVETDHSTGPDISVADKIRAMSG